MPKLSGSKNNVFLPIFYSALRPYANERWSGIDQWQIHIDLVRSRMLWENLCCGRSLVVTFAASKFESDTRNCDFMESLDRVVFAFEQCATSRRFLDDRFRSWIIWNPTPDGRYFCACPNIGAGHLKSRTPKPIDFSPHGGMFFVVKAK